MADEDIRIGITSTADTSGITQAKAAVDDLKSTVERSDILKPSTDWTTEDQARIDASLKTAVSQTKTTLDGLKTSVGESDALKPLPEWTDEDQAKLNAVWDSAINQAQKQADKLKLDDSFGDSLGDAADNLDDLNYKTADLDGYLRQASRSGQEAGKQIAAGSKAGNDAIKEQIQSASILRGTFARIAGGLALVTGAYQASKFVWQSLLDFIRRDENAAETRLNRQKQRLDDMRNQAAEISSANSRDIDANRIAGYYDREKRAVEEINRLLAEQLRLIDTINAAKSADLDAEQQIIEAQRRKEESLIRQRELTGTITREQADQQRLDLATSTAERLQGLQTRRDNLAVNAAQERRNAAQTALEQQQQQLNRYDGRTYARYSGDEYKQLYEQSRIAVAGTSQQYDNETAAHNYALNIEDTKQLLQNAGSGQEKARYESQLVAWQKMLDQVNQERRTGEAALARLQKIEQSMAEDMILPDMYDDELDRIKQIGDELDKARSQVKSLQEQVNQSRQTVNETTAELQQASGQQARNQLVNAANADADAASRKEQEIINTQAANAEKLAQVTASLDRAIAQFQDAARNMRNSPDPQLQRGLAPNTPGDRALKQAERVAGQGYATATDIEDLNKALADLRASNYPEAIRRQFESMITNLMKQLETAQARTQQLGNPADLQQQAAQRLNAGLNNVASQGRLPSNAIQAVQQTRSAIRDGEINREELTALKKTLDGLFRDTSSQAAQDVAKLITEYLQTFLSTQRRTRRGNLDGADSMALERQIIGIVENALADGTVDNDTERPMLQAAQAQLQAVEGQSEANQAIVQLINQILNVAEGGISDVTQLKSQLQNLSARVERLAEQTSRPRNNGR